MIPRYYKIFVDAHALDGGYEGSASFIRQLYSELVTSYPERYKIFFGCFNPNSVQKLFENSRGIEFVKYRSSNRYLRLLYDIPRVIRSVNPDLAHFQYFTPFVKNCRWHVTFHDVLFNDYPQFFPRGYSFVRNVLWPISARRADLLSTVSNYSRERLAAWYGPRLGESVVIPNGANILSTDGIRPVCSSVSEIISNPGGYILCVSRFEPRKNQAKLLEAYIKGGYWLRGLQLVFVGSRTLRVTEFDRVWSQIPEVIKSNIKMLFDIPISDMHLLNSNARVSVYPSFAEGFGMPPLESAVYGTPTICANTTGMSDFDFLSSFFFDPSDSGSIQTLIDQVLNSPQDVAVKMQFAKQEIRRRYSWSHSAKLLHQAMEKLGSNNFSAHGGF